MGERTKDLFETIEGYPQAQSPNADFFNCDAELSKMSFLHRLIHKLYFNLSGFKSFNKELPDKFEHLSRRIDLKGGALFAPVISFSASLIDDDQNLSPFERAAKLVRAAFELKDDVFSASLTPDYHNGQVLEMGQYPNLFATSQIIDNKKAGIYKAAVKNQITVICNGFFYILDLTDIDFKKESNLVTEALKQIGESSGENSGSDYLSPGIITASNNPVQLRIFNKLKEKENNRKSLELIKQSLFTLCLDLDSSPSTYEKVVKTAHSENLHNRWFHSSLQLIIFNNAKAGLVINFSANISGNNMMRAASEIAKRSLEFRISSSAATDNKQNNFVRLSWEVEQNQIDLAQNSFNRIKDTSNTESSLTLNKIGRKSFDKYEIHSVTIFILALQMTARKLLGQNPKITQFLTMSKYRCIDLLRSNVTTDESLELISYLSQKSYDKNEALIKLDMAINSQIRSNREVRRHLPIHEQIGYYISTLSGLSKFYNVTLNLIRILLLWISGYLKQVRTEIIVSHPKIYKEVPVIGRAGIRIPYAKYFGLHYQIFEEKINITMMPGLKWDVANGDFADELEVQLLKIKSIISG